MTKEFIAAEKELGKPKFYQHLSEETKKLFDLAPKTGIAEVRFKNPKRAGSVTIRSCKENKLTLVDDNGEPTIIRMVKKITLDLSIPYERLQYVVCKNHPKYISGSDACIYVLCLEDQAQTEVSTFELGLEAAALILKMTGRDLRNFARVIFLNPEVNNRRLKVGPNVTEQVIKKHLYDVVKEKPELIMNEYKDERRPYRELMREGLDTDVFTEKQGVYSFGTTRIGTTFEQAVEWLKTNEDILENIRKQISNN